MQRMQDLWSSPTVIKPEEEWYVQRVWQALEALLPPIILAGERRASQLAQQLAVLNSGTSPNELRTGDEIIDECATAAHLLNRAQRRKEKTFRTLMILLHFCHVRQTHLLNDSLKALTCGTLFNRQQQFFAERINDENDLIDLLADEIGTKDQKFHAMCIPIIGAFVSRVETELRRRGALTFERAQHFVSTLPAMQKTTFKAELFAKPLSTSPHPNEMSLEKVQLPLPLPLRLQQDDKP